MAESKPLASLTSGLLARKGGAAPAMRRQSALGTPDHGHGLDDLGWNDMGYDVGHGAHPDESLKHHAGLSPLPAASVHAFDSGRAIETPEPAAEPPVVEQQRRVEAAMVAPVVAKAPAQAVEPSATAERQPRAAVGARGRFAFTLRLDNQRHLMLRLASATSNRSAQQIVVALLDEYFAHQPTVSALAQQASSAKTERVSASKGV